jgi:hypothetical protein
LARVDPDLLAALEAAPAADRRQAGLAVARWAAERAGLPDAAADPPGAGPATGRLAAALDDRYFDLQRAAAAEQLPEAEALAAFARARAASAAEFALAGEAAEAAYEALAVADDPAAVRAVVAAALAGGAPAERGGPPDTGDVTG